MSITIPDNLFIETMPVFRINILYANKKRFIEHHLIDGVELDTYYRHVFRVAQKAQVQIVSFDVVQISELSREARFMRENKLTRMSPHVPTPQPRRTTYVRRRRPL